MNAFKRNWWILSTQGLFLVLLGCLAVFNTEFVLTKLVQFLGLTFLAFGLILAAWGWRIWRLNKRWNLLFTIGILELLLGLLILAYPVSATNIFAYIIGGSAVLMGLSQLFMGLRQNGNRFFLFLNGIVSVALGALIIMNPFESAKALTYLVGLYSIFLGIIIIYYSIRFRMAAKKGSQEE